MTKMKILFIRRNNRKVKKKKKLDNLNQPQKKFGFSNKRKKRYRKKMNRQERRMCRKTDGEWIRIGKKGAQRVKERRSTERKSKRQKENNFMITILLTIRSIK